MKHDDLSLRFGDGIKKFNAQEFYDCHDIFEDIWFEVRGSSRRFFQGLIHLAVGFYHILERNNPTGALSQLNKGKTKLIDYLPEFNGVDLKTLLEKTQMCIINIEQVQLGKKKFNEKLIPMIEYDESKFENKN